MLKTDYKDDILEPNQTQRKYTMTTSGGYTYITDATSYQQEGDRFGAADINATNTAVNKCVEYARGTLAARSKTITVVAPSNNKGLFFEGGHVEVYVPAEKVQKLVVAGIEIHPQEDDTASSCTVTFTSFVSDISIIDVYCK